jgi:hypothetical protein
VGALCGIRYRKPEPQATSGDRTGSFRRLHIAGGGRKRKRIFGEYEKSYAPARPTFENLSLYGQDQWKVSRRLSLDYGLRWEFNPAPGAADGPYPLALLSGNAADPQLAPPGTPQYHNVYHEFAPRLGFAYQCLGGSQHPVVIRGGFGVFYDTGQALGAAGYGGYPFSAFSQVANVSLPISSSNLVPPTLDFPLVPPYGFLSLSDPHLTLPYPEQWNLSLAVGLDSRNTFTTSYVGNRGKNLLYQEYMLPPNNPSFGVSGFDLNQNGASSSYNALQVQDQGYIAPGMQLIASYTWAHALDNLSTDSNDFVGLVRGNSDNDIRQTFNAAVNYSVPSENKGVLGLLVRNWVVATRFAALSGYPLDVVQNIYFLANGSVATFRPDLVAGVSPYLHNVPNVLGGWELNPAAFSMVPTDPMTGAPLRPGTLGRNYLHGPNFWTLNSGVQRSFALRDQLRLIFRVEAFNLFNHPNPSAGGIDANFSDTTFGQQTGSSVATIGVPNSLYGTGSARSLQLMLKLQF